MLSLCEMGCFRVSSGLTDSMVQSLREGLFDKGEVGRRCLLDEPLVRSVVNEIRELLVAGGFLQSSAQAIQAITFDKMAGKNWKVAWHQDVMFPFAGFVTHPDYGARSIKEGVSYARPPREVLDALLAVRLHLDDCGPTNGPLRISPGSHLKGVLSSREIREHVAAHGEMMCSAGVGDLLLMRPLLLHASSKATKPGHRRVLHLVYHSGDVMSERWYRAI